MGTFTVTGSDTLTLNGRVFNDLATGDVSSIELPNELVNLKTGKNGNSIFAANAQGLNGNLTLKLTRGSSDDQYMAAQLAQQEAGLSDFTLLSGSFNQRSGDGQGNTNTAVYNLAGGIFSKTPPGKDNTDGDVAQAEVTYQLKFAKVTRGIE